MLVFLFTDIEGSTRLWEEHTGVMTAVIARHDEILHELVSGHSGRVTKHTGDGITAAFEGGEPLACALQTQVCFAAESWDAIGELRIRIGLHAGEAEWLGAPGDSGGDYFGPPVNCAARIMSAAWGGQILLTPEVIRITHLPPGATLQDLGEHLLKNVSAPQQLFQLLHPDLPSCEFPPPRTLSGQSIRQAVGEQGARMASLAPPDMAVVLVSATLLPAVLGNQPPNSQALAGNVDVLRDLGAETLAGFLGQFAGRQPVGTPEEIRGELERELRQTWAGHAAIREDASRLLRAVHGVDATLATATGEVREALARGLAVLAGQFDEFRWMLGDVQETLAEMQGLQRQQLDLQQRQLDRTEELLALHKEQAHLPPTTAVVEPALQPRVPTFLEEDTRDVEKQSVFVAREAELARLDGFLEQALSGHGRVVFVTGGPGRGKTALLDEFARRAMGAHPDLLVASGNCDAYSGVGDPYLPFRELLNLLSGDAEAAWAAGAISRDHALRLWGALPLAIQALVEHGPHVVPALLSGPALLSRALAVAPSGASWLRQLRARVERRPVESEGLEQMALFQQVTHVLRALAKAHPLLLILDDLQWVDAASAGLLFHLGRRLEGCRILVAGTYRPEEVALGRGEAGHPLAQVLVEFKRLFGDAWLDLAGIRGPEGRRFVDAFLATEPNHLGEGFRRALFEHTGGHPLFTVELLREMQGRGDLVRDEDGCWVEGPALDWDCLPARVEGVIEARIGRLEEELRETLTVGSVEGEEFTAQVVARLQGLDERQTLRRLARELDRRHRLVREQPSVRVGRLRLSRYRFSHALFQKYLYDDLSDGERTLLHGEVAGVLEELYEDHSEEAAAIAPQLARHFSEAGDEGRALKYLILAGDAALAAYAHREAEGYYRRALGLVSAESEQAHLLWSLGEALYGQSRFREAIETWGEGIERYQALADSDWVARLYARSAWAAMYGDDLAESMRLCLKGLAVVEGAPESRGLADLLHATALTYALRAAPLEEGRPFAQQALEMADRLGDVEAQAEALATLPAFYLPAEEAVEALAKAVELAESNVLLGALARAHNNLGACMANYRGDLRAAQKHFLLAAELDGRAGRTSQSLYWLSNAISNLMAGGEFDKAESMFSQARALQRDLTEPTLGTRRLLDVELTYLLVQGEWAACVQQARALQASARKRGDDLDIATAGFKLAWAVLESCKFAGDAAAGKWKVAEAALEEVIEIHDRSTYRLAGVEARVELGRLCIDQGRLGDARRLLAESREVARSLSAEHRLEHVLQWLAAQIAGAEGRWGEAVAAHEAVAGFYARHGQRWDWARSLLDWAEAHIARDEPGDRERAVELLREAQAAFEEMGSPGYAAVAAQWPEVLEAAS